MEFSIKSRSPDKQKSACAVVGVYEQRKLTPSAKILDQASDGALTHLLKRGDIDGKAGSTLLFHAPAGLVCERILLVGLGKENEVTDKAYRDAVRAAIKAVSGTGAGEAAVYLAEVPVGQRDIDWKIEQAALVAGDALYTFDQLKSEKSKDKPVLRKLVLMVAADSVKAAEAAVARGQAIVNGVNLAKDLGNLPGNYCTPTYLADQARVLAKGSNLKVQVLEQKEIEKLGMGSFLSVAMGSDQPPKFIVMQYHGGAKNEKPVVLVGKGITFDSGGISIKPAAEMDEMKYDMCGAASVLGTMQAVAELKLPLNVVGLIPTCENLPSGSANKPGDIV
ncbi:MAG: leucyl aminopeptidase, partial [Parasulfuritortus sp.]|nr:leucyl aminopeptidase [Parasulfuritortus sp.]